MSIYSVRDDLLEAKLAIALTGAGVSVESGIPDFRSPGGLWERFPPEEHGTIDAFRRDPLKFWEFYLELARACAQARPNSAHTALAELEAAGLLAHVITQNVDGLHSVAGSRRVMELHGSPDVLVCLACGARSRARIATLAAPPRCACGEVLKPDVVLFGEGVSRAALDAAQELARTCDVCLVIGTSAQVHPATTIPDLAFRNGAILCEVNLEATSLTHSGRVRRFLEGSAGVILPRLVELLRQEGAITTRAQ